MTLDNARPSKRNGECGFSLVELVIALAILSLALVAIFSTFTFQHKSFVVQNEVAQMQQNLRGGMQFLEKDVRNAGAGLARLPSTVTVTLPAGLTGATAATANYGLAVLDGGGAGADSVYVIYVTGRLSQIPSSIGASDDIPVTDNTGWVAGDLGILFDTAKADLFQATSVSGLSISHSLFGTTDLSGAYAAGSWVGKVYFAGYSIDNTTVPAHPRLMQRTVTGVGTAGDQIVADDIEDLQVRLILADGTEGNRTDVGISGNLANLRQARIQMVVRTATADANWSEGPYLNPLFNRTAAPEGYTQHRRRPAMMVIDIRNAGLAP